jgi:hypothetical protein
MHVVQRFKRIVVVSFYEGIGLGAFYSIPEECDGKGQSVSYRHAP